MGWVWVCGLVVFSYRELRVRVRERTIHGVGAVFHERLDVVAEDICILHQSGVGQCLGWVWVVSTELSSLS